MTNALGNVYVADDGNCRIRMIDPMGDTTTIAGNGTEALRDGSGGPNGTAEFDHPFGLTIDGAGNILVVDDQDQRVRRIDLAGNVTTLPCTGAAGVTFFDPFAIAFDRSGQILISDGNNNRICEFLPTDVEAVVIAGGTQGNLNGSGTAAHFDYPIGVAVDHSGSIYVADSVNNIIRKIDPFGNVTGFAGDGHAGFADGPSSSAEFSQPYGLAFDPKGDLIVAEAGGNRIRVVDIVGNVATVAGNGTQGDADGTGGPNGTAEFDGPSGVAVDGECNIYVAGNYDNRIRKITFAAAPP